MKKMMILFLFICSLLVLTACNNEEKEEIIYESKEKVIEQFENQNTFVFVLGSKRCSWCIKYKDETLNTYLQKENHLPLYLVELYTFSQAEFSEFCKNYGVVLDKGTPTTYYVKNGIVVDLIAGKISLEVLEDFINKNME